MSIQQTQSSPLPSADEIFQRPTPEADFDELIFEGAAELNNPLAPCLVAALRKVRELRQNLESYRSTLQSAIELLHTQEADLQRLRRRNLELLDELRDTRRATAA